MKDLAKRIDEFMRDFDPYEYNDNEGSIEEVEELLKTSPETIINYLLDIIEE